MIFLHRCAAAALAAAMLSVAPAHAQDAGPVGPLTVSGSAALTSQYRFRGVSLSDEELAVQAGLSASHESGLYVGTWGSSLSGFGSFGGSNVELDVYGGYKADLGNAAVDVGLLWYLYPGTDDTDYAEVYASVTGALGPASVKVGLNYAPDQQAIGDEDNWYWYGDASYGVPATPITLKAHVGYTTGDGSTLSGPDGNYVDWLIGADYAWRNFTVGVAYVDTDIKKTPADAFFTVPGGKLGRDLVDAAVVVSLTAAF